MQRLITALAILILWMAASPIGAQVPVRFEVTFGEEPLELGEVAYDWRGSSISIDRLRFYVGEMQLWKGDKIVWREAETYRLLDVEHPPSLSFALHPPADLDYDALRFTLGVDSLTNVSGAFGGDLDPTKGMYWTWNSGYINFKLEGRSPICPTRKQTFQFHLGGYLPPHQTIQGIQLPATPGQSIALQLDIAQLLQHIDLSEQHTVMSPGAAAASLSALTAKAFRHGEH